MKSRWLGSTDLEVLSGTATFDDVEIKLESFKDYRKIEKLLHDARIQGRLSAVNEIRRTMQRTIDSITGETLCI